jgi:hypothetical protein
MWYDGSYLGIAPNSQYTKSAREKEKGKDGQRERTLFFSNKGCLP